jgi:hypothetical protein
MSMKVAYIRWQDAAFISPDWKAVDDLPDPAAFQLISAGLVVKETDEGTYLATDYAADSGEYRYTCFVPRLLVLERREFEI